MKENAIQDTLRQLSQTFFSKIAAVRFFFFPFFCTRNGKAWDDHEYFASKAGPRDFATMKG